MAQRVAFPAMLNRFALVAHSVLFQSTTNPQQSQVHWWWRVQNWCWKVTFILRTSRSSWWSVRVWMLPLLEERLCLIDQCLLLAGFPDVLLSLEERPDVHGLASPQVSVNRPVKGEFEGAAVQGKDASLVGHSYSMDGRQRRQPSTCEERYVLEG